MSDVRVLIIGGGVMGTSLLYHLVKAGWQDVVLVEKNDLTHGSTWHAAGLCTHFAHNPTIQELRATSVRLYRDVLPQETGQSCGFHPSGAMRITRNSDRMDEFRHVAGLSGFTGYPLEILTPERIFELHPLAQLDGLLGGIYEPDDGHVDPTLATNAMAQVATKSGATISRYNPVQAIRREGDRWVVETAKATYRAQHIVNAAGTWGFEIGQMMGVNVPSVPVLHQYLVTDTVAAVTERQAQGLPELPIIRDPEESWYVRQERDGLILGPYEKQAQVWSVDGVPPEFGADLMPPDLDRVEHIIEAAMARIPALGEGGCQIGDQRPDHLYPRCQPADRARARGGQRVAADRVQHGGDGGRWRGLVSGALDDPRCAADGCAGRGPAPLWCLGGSRVSRGQGGGVFRAAIRRALSARGTACGTGPAAVRPCTI